MGIFELEERPLERSICEGTEYHFVERVNGNPPRKGEKPGQVVVYESRGYKVRVPFDRLPTILQYKFVKHTKRTAKELGVTFRCGCGA